MRVSSVFACAIVAGSLFVWGQTNETLIPKTKPLATSEALKSFQIEEGLKIELTASEPFVRSPAAIAWDESARLFAAENPGYPVGPGPGKPPVGAIVELRDRNQDGVVDERIEFATGLHYPNGLMPWSGGWLVTDAPDLLWLCDTNADGKADIREVWFTGFATNQTTQLRACYPTFGPDGWIYISRGWSGGIVTSPKWTNLPPVDLKAGDFRFRPDGSAAEAIGGNAQFGMVLDDAGRRFLTSNRNPIMHAVAWPHWWKRMPGFYFNEIVQDVSPVDAEAKVFPLSADLTTSGFMPELMSTPHAGTFTSACGLHQFFGESMPQKFQGSWFICEPAQNLVQRQIMEPDGPSFRSRRATEDAEFLASSDTWFHPVYAATGPDGAVYIADMYRKFIDHPEYLPKDTRERIDFDSGKQMGRIWKISSANAHLKSIQVSTNLPTLADALHSGNKWRRETAHRLIAQDRNTRAVELLTRRLLETLERQGSLEMSELVRRAESRQATETKMAESNARARTILLLSDFLHQKNIGLKADVWNSITHILLMGSFDASPAVRETVFKVFQHASDSHNPLPDVSGEVLRIWANDPNPAVRFQMAYSLGQGDYRRMTEALVRILRKDATNRWTRAVVLSGLGARMNEFAEKWFAGNAQPLSGETNNPAGFDESEGMLALAYEMGLVYGAPSSKSGSALWQHALNQKADGTAWQASLLTGWSTATRQDGQLQKADAPLLALARARTNFLPKIDLEKRLGAISALNEKIAADAAVALPKRVASAKLLGELPSNSGREALLNLLTPSAPKDLQLAAGRALSRSINSSLAERLLLKERWGSFSPELREIFLSVFLSKPGLSKILLQAIEEEKIPGWSINANRRKALQQSGDAEVKSLALKVLGKTGGEDRIKIFNEYKSVLDLKTNPQNGQEIFTKTCASCHQHQGKGFKVGPDLTGVHNQPAEALLYHILAPDAEIYPGFQNYELETKSGDSFSGILINENETTITLQRALGEKDQIPRAQIKQFRATHSSLMPNELEKTMSKQELADLIGFLKQPEFRKAN